MKWLLPILMILIIVPGLHYAGLIQLFESKHKSDKKNWSFIPSPPLQTQNLKGETFSLAQLKGKLILLNFWASWCQTCYEEFPELIEAVQWAKGDIQLVAISVDSSKKDIKMFLKKMQKNYRQGFDSQNIHIIWDPQYEVTKQFHVIRFPETFILDKELKIVRKYTGLFSLKKAKPVLTKFLPAKEPKSHPERLDPVF